MKILCSSFLIFLTSLISAQSITINNTSVVDLINNQFSGFTGEGVSVFNVKVNGVMIDSTYTIGNIASFTNSNTLFPLNSGFLLTTGNSNGAIGPNNSTSSTSNNPPTSNVSSDTNLTAIANGNVTNGVVLEFDFIAVGDSISFNYMFGSEEYPEFSPSSFNDAFGFFLWGPNISGPYTYNGYPNGGVNIATLPDGLTPVTINNVGDANNVQYYVFNDAGSAFGNAIQYDGSTVLMTAGYSVECGEVYHIKMAICNVGDQSYDSGVFLKANSLNSTSTFACGKNYGLVFYDYNENCIKDYLDFGVENVTITIQPGNYVSTTNQGGFWVIDSLPYGNYTITIDTTNLYWNLTCPITQNFTIDANNQSSPNFGLVDFNPCTDPDVSIYAPILRRCFSNQKVYIQACNQSTATGVINASYVDVELDPLMTITGSSIPYAPQGNNVYRFQTGDIYPGQCVNFNINCTVSCNALNGQTLCMDANLHPVEPCVLDNTPSDPIVNDGTGGTLNGFPQACTLPWDQSSLSVDGWCANDSIYFTITNTGEPGGGDMECYSPMWITVDGVVTYTDSVMIQGGQTLTLSFPGDGQTWILNAEQHPLHPGNSHPNAHVEACGDTTNWTPDIVNDFPQDDADPVVDIYCGVVTGSYDPNDKTGYPVGQTINNYIQPNQQLQYVIRFQNTGTDTAFTVVIRDTLDTDLNIFTVTPGVSSHNYQFRMYGPRVLEWTFENILLPDSTTNQEASNGFVTFHVNQVPNLTPGTEITNDADIYFDFNDPITTNTTIHRIYEGFVEVLSIEDLESEGKPLLVYPNPTSHSIIIKGKDGMNQAFSIFDQMGRIVFNGKLNGPSSEVNLSNLSKGIYTLKIDGNYKPAQIVKE